MISDSSSNNASAACFAGRHVLLVSNVRFCCWCEESHIKFLKLMKVAHQTFETDEIHWASTTHRVSCHSSRTRPPGCSRDNRTRSTQRSSCASASAPPRTGQHSAQEHHIWSLRGMSLAKVAPTVGSAEDKHQQGHNMKVECPMHSTCCYETARDGPN